MTFNWKTVFVRATLGVLFIVGLTQRQELHADEPIQWQPETKRINAHIPGWPLEKVLHHLATSTGWSVYVEPGADERISAKFKDLPAGQALQFLFGNLNFALLPSRSGPSTLYVYRTQVSQATREITPDKKPPSSIIPNELIVTLEPDSDLSIDVLAAELGAEVVSSIDGLNAFRLRFKDEAAADAARRFLNQEEPVASIDHNFAVDLPERITQQLQRTTPPPFRLKPKKSDSDDTIVIGMLDTAVQELSPEMEAFLLPRTTVAGESTVPADSMAHGTSMAQTILQGLALSEQDTEGSAVRILPVDIYGASEGTSTFEVANGIYSAINQGADVINLSLGGKDPNPFLNRTIVDLRQQGVLFFGSAGNDASETPVFPAAYPEVVAVTAADSQGQIAPYANHGQFVDVIAPGLSVVEHNGQPYYVNGTSTSTAYVTGAAASYQAQGKKPDQVEAYIRQVLQLKKQP